MRGLPESGVVSIERGGEAVIGLAAAAESIVGIERIEGDGVVDANIAAVDVGDEAVVDAADAGVAEAFAEVQPVASVYLQSEDSRLELMHRCVLGIS